MALIYVVEDSPTFRAGFERALAPLEWYLPCAHVLAVHEPLPAKSWYCPATQAAHVGGATDARLFLYWPCVHELSLHTTCPVCSWYLSTWQSLHSSWPGAFWYLPASQLVQPLVIVNVLTLL